MYADEGASHSEWNDSGITMQRLIPFRAHIRSHLAERRSQRQSGPAMWNSIVWGNADSMWMIPPSRPLDTLGGGIGGSMLKRPEPNSCYTKAPKSFLCGEVEREGKGKTHGCAWQLSDCTSHSNSSWKGNTQRNKATVVRRAHIVWRCEYAMYTHKSNNKNTETRVLKHQCTYRLSFP